MFGEIFLRVQNYHQYKTYCSILIASILCRSNILSNFRTNQSHHQCPVFLRTGNITTNLSVGTPNYQVGLSQRSIQK